MDRLPQVIQDPIGSRWGSLFNDETESKWWHTTSIPFIFAILSLLFWLFRALVAHVSHGAAHLDDRANMSCQHPHLARRRLKSVAFLSQDAAVVILFKALRFGGCSILVLLSLRLLFGAQRKHAVLPNARHLMTTATYCYSTLLAAGAMKGGKWNQLMSYNNDLILFLSFSAFTYRNVWPLMTYTGTPTDSVEGSMLWIEGALLMLVSVGYMLFVPRPYVPVDVEHPAEQPNPEQTASIFSRVIYSYMDPIVKKASKLPHLPHTEIPPLADYYYSNYLVDHSLPHLDPLHGTGKRHLFFGLCRIFWREFLAMSAIIILQAISNFLSPIALNRILAALESGSDMDYVRPWFWVICLFLARISMTLCWQGYSFMATVVVAQTQAILTELLFEHSLRVRLKAGQSDRMDAGEGQGRSKDSHTEEKNLIGRINTMVTVDVDSIAGAKDFLMIVIQGPLELVFAAVFLFKLLGWSAVIAFTLIVLLLPVPGYIGGQLQRLHHRRMEKTDARVQTLAEVLRVIRMVKMFGWENRMQNNLNEKRENELALLWKEKLINLSNDVITFIIPTITMLVTYGTYTWVMGESITASKVFSTMAVFEIVRNLLRRTSFLFGLSVKGKVSLDRVNSFLLETELLDSFSDDEARRSTIPVHVWMNRVIGFGKAEFTWSKLTNPAADPSAWTFRLQFEGELSFKRGAINLIVGPTGSGKTSILMALLGEMHFIPLFADSWSNLPREDGIAYAAQETWVQHDTIKNNILFGSPYDEARYQKVLYQCALSKDLELFEAGDETEAGERGITLSGGQKARVTLARAIYSSAGILLLDDVLAALDVHTSKWIVEKCFQGDLMQGRTVILITHHVELVSPIADHIVSVGLDGVVRAMGKDINTALANDSTLAYQVEQTKQEDDIQEKAEVVQQESIDKPAAPSGKLIMAEEIAEGRVSREAYMLYLRGLGSTHPFLFLVAWMSGLVLIHAGSVLAVWFLGYWSHQYETGEPQDVNVPFNLLLYSSILLISTAIYVMTSLIYNSGTLKASRSINAQLIHSVLRSTFRWLDQTPISRIITRCSQDIARIDDNLAESLSKVVDMGLAVLIKLGGVVWFTPVFLLPGAAVTALGVYLGNVYLRAQMSMMRESSNARAPVLAHFGDTLSGLVSIRAYGAQARVKAESLKRIDHYTKVSKTSYDLNRWIGVRIDFLGAVFACSLAGYLLYLKTSTNLQGGSNEGSEGTPERGGGGLTAGDVGFSLTMALEFCALILWLVRYWNFLEVDANSLERIQAYLDITHEAPPTDAGRPPAAWPTSGELRVEKLSARYSETGPNVLHQLTFHVRSGERIGIVGRTGSGKSSLTLSLLRLIFTDGAVYYDGIRMDKINLDALRSSVTIIPQVPELLAGSLRENLDPFKHHSDATINDALRSAGLFTLQRQHEGQEELGDPSTSTSTSSSSSTSKDNARLTLDTQISSGGANLSMGQRQIVALARAVVNSERSKLVILDEDHETDTLIQTYLRTQLAPDVTVLTVAHRLRSVMDADRIMVLDKGNIVEFDAPRVLLEKEDGYFKSLVDDSRQGDREAAYEMMAGGR
ncbi:hypothetical protein CVT26_007733 [Gymnopilus dilepis]|uniref:Uncharacterized protein n=1 Tax=Gymnopilus dilepis TaxID=231916 RepID=A0A409VZY7_9AGAR|nr:hypothetical protein CVT26_007733 [Gymnopilus dilepis]